MSYQQFLTVLAELSLINNTLRLLLQESQRTNFLLDEIYNKKE